LITELQRIGAEMPGLDTEGMRVPTVEQMLAWSAVVEAARRDDLATACQLMAESQFPYQVVEFTDLPSESRRVILLREDLPIRAGWGTVVLRPDATQELLIEVPHPLEDSRTRTEGSSSFVPWLRRRCWWPVRTAAPTRPPPTAGGRPLPAGRLGRIGSRTRPTPPGPCSR
jgi:hypothetical protein